MCRQFCGDRGVLRSWGDFPRHKAMLRPLDYMIYCCFENPVQISCASRHPLRRLRGLDAERLEGSAVLGRSWDALGWSWDPLGASWTGMMKNVLIDTFTWRFWARLGGLFLEPLGSLLGFLGSSWGLLGGLLGSSFCGSLTFSRSNVLHYMKKSSFLDRGHKNPAPAGLLAASVGFLVSLPPAPAFCDCPGSMRPGASQPRSLGGL